ncbi:MAG: hypothetical protein HY520_02150 [Candidatus Aenigmarchaeota archaeon]|nr:hypothetical protein [Candidatus Aenigmarchaeota archaeon]
MGMLKPGEKAFLRGLDLQEAGFAPQGSRCSACGDKVMFFFLVPAPRQKRGNPPHRCASRRHRIGGPAHPPSSGTLTLCSRCASFTRGKPQPLLREFKHTLDWTLLREGRGYQDLRETITFSQARERLEQLRQSQQPLADQVRSLPAAAADQFIQQLLAKQARYALSPKQMACLERFLASGGKRPPRAKRKKE